MRGGWRAGEFIFDGFNFTQENFKYLIKFGSRQGYAFADQNFRPLLDKDLGNEGSYNFRDQLQKIYDKAPNQSITPEVRELGRQLGVGTLSQRKNDPSYFREIFRQLNARIRAPLPPAPAPLPALPPPPLPQVVQNFNPPTFTPPIPPTLVIPTLPTLTPPIQAIVPYRPPIAPTPIMSFYDAQVMAIKMCMGPETFPECITNDPSEFPAYQKAILDLTGVRPDNYREVEFLGVFYIETKGMDDANETLRKTVKAMVKVNKYAADKLLELRPRLNVADSDFQKIADFLIGLDSVLRKGQKINV